MCGAASPVQEMGGRLWRNREASCLAMSDLLQASMADTWVTGDDTRSLLLDIHNAPRLLQRGKPLLLCLVHCTVAAAARVCNRFCSICLNLCSPNSEVSISCCMALQMLALASA